MGSIPATSVLHMPPFALPTSNRGSREKQRLLSADPESAVLPLEDAQRSTSRSYTTSTTARVIRFISLCVLLLLLMLRLSPSIRSLLPVRTCSQMASSRTVYTASDDVASLLAVAAGDTNKAVKLPPNAISYKLPSGDAIPSVALGTAGKGETYGPVLAALKAVSDLSSSKRVSVYATGLLTLPMIGTVGLSSSGWRLGLQVSPSTSPMFPLYLVLTPVPPETKMKSARRSKTVVSLVRIFGSLAK